MYTNGWADAQAQFQAWNKTLDDMLASGWLDGKQPDHPMHDGWDDERPLTDILADYERLEAMWRLPWPKR